MNEDTATAITNALENARIYIWSAVDPEKEPDAKKALLAEAESWARIALKEIQHHRSQLPA